MPKWGKTQNGYLQTSQI